MCLVNAATAHQLCREDEAAFIQRRLSDGDRSHFYDGIIADR
jgi:hypothetical protein